jgi:hypothetical protein
MNIKPSSEVIFKITKFVKNEQIDFDFDEYSDGDSMKVTKHTIIGNNYPRIIDYIKQNNLECHEIVRNDYCRLFFDMESADITMKDNIKDIVFEMDQWVGNLLIGYHYSLVTEHGDLINDHVIEKYLNRSVAYNISNTKFSIHIVYFNDYICCSIEEFSQNKRYR